jgi:hypothetical protein
MFCEIIAHFSCGPNAGVPNRGYVVHGKVTEMSASELYYNSAKPSACSTLDKLAAAVLKKNKSDVRAWLEHQDAYTHRTIRERLYKYFTYKYTYRYIDVLPKFVKAYNDMVH